MAEKRSVAQIKGKCRNLPNNRGATAFSCMHRLALSLQVTTNERDTIFVQRLGSAKTAVFRRFAVPGRMV